MTPDEARPGHLGHPDGTSLAWLSGGTIGLAGLVLLFSGVFQTATLPGWVDAGIYLGYALNLPALVERYGLDGVTYHGSRLSYVLIRYFLHRTFSPELAQDIEVGGLYVLSIAAVFLLGWVRCGANATRLVATFVAFNPLFISSLVFGGTDGVTIVYLLAVAVTLFSAGGIGMSPSRLAIGGVFAGLALIAHLFAVVPLAGIGVAHLWVVRPANWTPLKYGWGLFGVVAAVIALGAVGLAFGLDFLFFGYSIQMAGRSFQGIGTNYQIPLELWLPGAYRVFVPLFLLLYSGFLLLVTRRLLRDRFLVGSFLALLIASAVYLAWDSVLNGVVIQTRPYFNLLFPLVVMHLLALGGALLRGSHGGRLHGWVLSLPALAIGLSPGAFSALERPFVEQTVFVVLLTGFLGVLIWALRTAAGTAAPTLSLLFLLACSATMNADSIRVFRAATGLSYREAYQGSVHFAQWLESSGLAERRPRIWFDREELNEKLGSRGAYRLRFRDAVLSLNYYDTLCSLYLWHRVLFSDSLTLRNEAGQTDNKEELIVFLTQDMTKIEHARQLLTRQGYQVAIVASDDYSAPSFGWHARAFARSVLPVTNGAWEVTQNAWTK